MRKRRPWSRVKSHDDLILWFSKQLRLDEKCWIWTGALADPAGYGCCDIKYVRQQKLPFKTHRLAYTLAIGPIPDGMLVCHRCDRPGCVNPSHLFLGTAQENVTDMIEKGRAAFQKKAA